MPTILIVDDDAQMLELMGQLLEREGYDVGLAASSAEALLFVEQTPPDLFIIDLLLPGEDGLALCQKLRRNPRTATLPVVFITGEDAVYSVGEALAAGGDDYIRKPFVVRELLARLRAHLRRARSSVASGTLPVIWINTVLRTVMVDQRPVDLTHVEYDLLRYMCAAPTRLHSAHDLLMSVWHYPADAGDVALVRNHIRNLRRKLEDSPERPEIIQSRHGRGYTIKARVQVLAEHAPAYA
ncbi:MAG: DNA-binding response regulator [Chloroflexota bacterium]|nr:MAG: DNA-binding response regulator [Chloroflexota bacterium]